MEDFGWKTLRKHHVEELGVEDRSVLKHVIKIHLTGSNFCVGHGFGSRSICV
jgi:hypothetical protein